LGKSKIKVTGSITAALLKQQGGRTLMLTSASSLIGLAGASQRFSSPLRTLNIERQHLGSDSTPVCFCSPLVENPRFSTNVKFATRKIDLRENASLPHPNLWARQSCRESPIVSWLEWVTT
jgi:hypothetical protein